ncbi:MAG: zf-TFIIB domain-containing protein [Myxococcota bacterium]
MPLHDVELAGLLELASARFASHGRDLFKLRAWALRGTSLLGLAGVVAAQFTRDYSRPLALAQLALFSAPALFCAPGLVAGTLAAARGEEMPKRVFVSYAHRALSFGVLGAARFVVTMLLAVFAGPFAFIIYLRLRFAEFVMLDENAPPWRALVTSYRLTQGMLFATLKVSFRAYFDALQRYGLLRWQLDNRVRLALLDVLVYDSLRRPAAASEDAALVSSEIATASVAPAFVAPPGLATRVVASPPPPTPARIRASVDGPGCPRCGEALVKYDDGEISLLRCGSRHGVWANNVAAQRIVQAKLPDIVVREIGAFEGTAPPLHDPRDAIACPVCATRLATTWVPAAQLHVDACTQHGTWFDTGELERVARAYVKAHVDRAEIAALLAKPHASPYARGIPAMAEAFGATVLELASTAVDHVVEGREEDRTDMWLRVAGAAVGIATGGSDDDSSSD